MTFDRPTASRSHLFPSAAASTDGNDDDDDNDGDGGDDDGSSTANGWGTSSSMDSNGSSSKLAAAALEQLVTEAATIMCQHKTGIGMSTSESESPPELSLPGAGGNEIPGNKRGLASDRAPEE